MSAKALERMYAVMIPSGQWPCVIVV
jgi:hypothetical protein